MSSVNPDDEQQHAQQHRWVPTHVQVTVLRARGLRGKGKGGTSDVYTIIQVGKEKYSTCVVERSAAPEWREECCFELLPGALEEGGRGACPPGSCDLVLTVMHRALIGLDVFLGQAVVPLDQAFQDNVYAKNEAEWVNLRSRWFRLNSKTGKKEKERGEVQATVQFTRNNLTASMYHLAMKDKSLSAFSKLKERMRGKRRSSVDDDAAAAPPGPAAAAPPPAGRGAPRTRLPSDGGGEEEYEDDEGGEGRRNKMRTFFLRGKLRKSSETRSSTSLGSESSESSSRGGSLSPTAGISVVVSDLSNSPSNSSNLTADNSPEHTADTSPKLSPDHSEFSDQCHEISIAVPALYRNGVHRPPQAPPLQPGPGGPVVTPPPAAQTPAAPAPAKASQLGLGLLLRPLPTSLSLQNLSPREEEPPRVPGAAAAGDGRRWSFDKPGEDEKAAIAAALEKSGPMVGDEEEEEEEEEAPSAATGAARESYDRKRKKKMEDAALERTGKSWFGSKDSNSKPSAVAPPKLGPIPESAHHHHHHPPPPPLVPPSRHPPWGPSAPPAPPSTPTVPPLHHTNPFHRSQGEALPPPISPGNPFLSTTLRHHPSVSPQPPPLPPLSSARPPVAHLFSQEASRATRGRLTSWDPAGSAPAIPREGEASAQPKGRPLPPPPPAGAEERPPSRRSPNPFACGAALEPEWDDSFEAFASCRLQSGPRRGPAQNSPEGPLLEFWDIDKEEPPQNTEPVRNPHRQHSCLGTLPEASSDWFAQLLAAIPETNQEASMLPTSALDPPGHPGGCADANPANSSSNTDLASTTPPLALCIHCQRTHCPSTPCEVETLRDSSDSSDPSSSGVGSLAEEDVLSGTSSSSASEKLSSGLGDDAKTRSVSGCTLSPLERSPDQTVVGPLRDSSGKPVDRSCPLVVGRNVEGGSSEASDPNEKPQSVILMEDPQWLVPLSATSLAEMQPGAGPSEEHIPAHVSLFDLYSINLNPSIPSDLGLGPSVFKTEKTEGDFRLQESFGVLHGPENLSFQAAQDDEQTVIPDVLDTKGTPLCPSFHTMTSFLGDESSLLEAPFGTGSLDDQLVHQSSPKTSELPCVDSGQTTMSAPILVFNESSLMESPLGPLVRVQDGPLQSGNWLTPSPGGSGPRSLDGSADSQHYQTCLTHNSSAATTVSAGSPAERPSEDARSSLSTLCDAESCEESSQVLLPENLCTPGPQRSTGERGTERELEVDPETEVEWFPSEEPASCSETHSSADAPRGSVIGSRRGNYGGHTVGTQENVGTPSEYALPARSQTRFPALQRCYSTGTLVPGCPERPLTSYGSDPSVVQSLRFPPDPARSPPLPLPPPSCSPIAPLARRALPSANVNALPTPGPAPSAPPPAPRIAPALEEAHAAVRLEEVQRPEKVELQQNSPHPVRPLTPGPQGLPESRSVLASGLEKLRSTIQPGRSSPPGEAGPERRKSLTEGAGSYYHLNHNELVALLVRREADLARQGAEFERQTALLSRREVELRRLKPQVRDLENYIDTLLVRIMEQTPTLLQVRSKFK